MLTAVEQHGAESHFLRPDGVMRSSIIRAIPGYDPVANAQGVALRFTQPHYQATTLSGASGISLFDRVRFSIANAFARQKAIAVMRRANAVAGLAGFGNSDTPYEAGISLPSVSGPGQYGFVAANEQMAHVAARLTAGFSIMPDVAQSQYQAAQAIAPAVTAMPSALAAQVTNYVPAGVVASGAFQRAMSTFDRLRMWWYG